MADMAQTISDEIYQGETFFKEVRLRDETGVSEDLSGVTKTVQCSSEISESDITVTDGTETGYVEIRADADQTASWPPGEHEIQLWFDYGVLANVEDEIQLIIRLKVREAI
jgi:hypothetical protein